MKRRAPKSKQTQSRQRAHAYGISAETYAAWFLRLKGWRILKRRYKTKVGEIDLIAKRGKTVIFVEVKARRSRDAALEAVTLKNQKRVSRAAKIFVSKHPKAGFYTLRFDVVLVCPWQLPEHLPNAFYAKD